MKTHVEFIPVTNQSLKHIEKNMKEGDIMLVPQNNLLSGLENEEIYYSKLADELIRYNRIKQFMFKPNMFLSFTDLKYNLNSDEIILLHSLLTSDYFDDLIPDITNKYISFNSYDNTEPNISQKYDNTYTVSTDSNVKNKQAVERIGSIEKPNISVLPDKPTTKKPKLASKIGKFTLVDNV